MQTPLQIDFHNMDHSPAVEAKLRERAAKLETMFDRITGCRVVVEAPHRHSRKGKLYNVRIELDVPGKVIVANRNGPKDHAHEDIYVAIRDAFDAVTRQLEDHARVIRGEVKTHGED
jgi:ribosomal subunit interface protein